MTIDPALLSDIRFHAGCPVPPEAVELVFAEAEKASKQRGTPLEFVLAEQVKALWAEANQRQFNAAGKPVDFEAFCKAKLAKNDSLFSKLLGRKSKVQAAVAEVQQIEAEITGTKDALLAADNKAAELNGHIAATEAELEDHNAEAVEASIQSAAAIWHLKHQSPFNGSKVDAAVYHAAQAEVVTRILSARLIQLRDALKKEESKVESLKAELKRLEKCL